MQEKVRVLQDENEKLESENNRLKSDCEMMKVIDDDLKAEIIDKDEEINKMNIQVSN